MDNKTVKCAQRHWWSNRRFPEITGEDNLTVFSYSGRVKSPEWRWGGEELICNTLRSSRMDLLQFILDYQLGELLSNLHAPCDQWVFGISDVFSAFCLQVSVILPTCSLYPQQKRAYSALHPQAWTYIYRSMPEGSYRVQSPGFPKIVYCQHSHVICNQPKLSCQSWSPN